MPKRSSRSYFANPSAIDTKPGGYVMLSVASSDHTLHDGGIVFGK
ncbi:hypothetical protein [Mesorhizobium sp.]|nr:hypothetical protein [Mesorhizobium sp.]